MPEILDSAKPISMETFVEIIEKGVVKTVIDRFSDPVAIIDAEQLFFYVCKADLLHTLYSDTQTLQMVLDTYLDIKNPSDLIVSLKAYQKLLIKHRTEYNNILNELKKDTSFSLDELGTYVEKTLEQSS